MPSCQSHVSFSYGALYLPGGKQGQRDRWEDAGEGSVQCCIADRMCELPSHFKSMLLTLRPSDTLTLPVQWSVLSYVTGFLNVACHWLPKYCIVWSSWGRNSPNFSAQVPSPATTDECNVKCFSVKASFFLRSGIVGSTPLWKLVLCFDLSWKLLTVLFSGPKQSGDAPPLSDSVDGAPRTPNTVFDFPSPLLDQLQEEEGELDRYLWAEVIWSWEECSKENESSYIESAEQHWQHGLFWTLFRGEGERMETLPWDILVSSHYNCTRRLSSVSGLECQVWLEQQTSP